MAHNADAEQIGQVSMLYLELVQLFEQAQHLQAESTQLLDRARQTRTALVGVDQQALPDTAPPPDVPLSPEETLDAIITLLSDFSLATQIAIAKALGLGLAATVRAQLNVKRPPVA